MGNAAVNFLDGVAALFQPTFRSRTGTGQRICAFQQSRLYSGQRPNADANLPYPCRLLTGNIFNLRDKRLEQIAGSCTAVCSFGGEDLVKQLPRGPSLMGRHFLDRITDMDQDEVADRHRIVLKQEQAHLALDALGATPGQETVNGPHFHRNSQAHDFAPIRTKLIYIKAAT